jgi:hypothetical protein
MSDLQQPPRLHDLTVDDPSITRILNRRADVARSAEMLSRAGEVATSVTVVIPVGGTGGLGVAESLGGWQPVGVRVEVLVMEDVDDPGRPILRDHLSRSGRPWRVLDRPMGGRAAAMAAAATGADHEFLIVSTGGQPAFEYVPSALCDMWGEGCDAAMVEPDGAALQPTGNEPSDDAAGELVEWLGLRGTPEPGRLVVMRRWVARWLFNEITRAIHPGDEVADRARLLGIGIVRVSSSEVPSAAGA